MKAAQIHDYGHADAVQIVDINKPALSDDAVLVEVYASSLNPFDTVIREGYMKDMIPLTFPVTLGGDIAGVVREVGGNVSSVSVGDKVYGQANAVAGNSGAFAEFAVTAASQLAAAPVKLSFNEIASLPLVGVSALQGLTEHIAISKGQKLFIHGGAGGIGSIAIQIAKRLGAYVATTATGEGIEYVKSLGADQVIDYKSEDFAAVLNNFDAVFELAGGKEFDKTLKVLKKGGVAVSMIAQPNEDKTTELGVSAFSQSTHVNTERLEALTKLVNDGVITAHVDQVFSFSDIKAAFDARESGNVKGKIVLEIKKG